jgi:hypothetical protein
MKAQMKQRPHPWTLAGPSFKGEEARKTDQAKQCACFPGVLVVLTAQACSTI